MGAMMPYTIASRSTQSDNDGVGGAARCGGPYTSRLFQAKHRSGDLQLSYPRMASCGSTSCVIALTLSTNQAANGLKHLKRLR